MLTQMVALIVRLVAVWLGLECVRGVLTIMVPTPSDWGSAAPMAAFAAAELVAAILLWRFPLTVAKNICPVTESADLTGLSPKGLYEVGMILIGVYWLATAINGAFYWFVYLVVAANNKSTMTIDGPDAASIAMTCARFVIGTSLILGREGIRQIIFRIRYGSHERYDL